MSLLVMGLALLGLLVSGLVLIWASGFTVISDDEVGIVTKGFSTKSLENGKVVATNGEAGIQADTLPPGWHFFLWPWQYSIEKVPMIIVPESELALIIANDGKSVAEGRILGDKVECNNYQDAKAFLLGGGYKGRQAYKLTTGTYRINTRLFTVITKSNAKAFNLDVRQLDIVKIPPGYIGLVTVLDGMSPDNGDIAAKTVLGHSTFQDEQNFFKNGGYRGLQQEVLMPGSWSINPWFATIEPASMTTIPVAHVGVIVSYVGDAGDDVSGNDFKYGDIVENGYKGVWQKPLNPGVYAINTRTAKVEIVPTSNFVLNWNDRTEAHGLDAELSAIKIQSRDGFEFPMAVQQIIHVPYDVAPKLIARFGTMTNLVQNVLEPLIGNYFRNAGQAHEMLEFILTRKERQDVAKKYVTEQLRAYNVEGVDTLIGELIPPAQLMKTLQDRKIAEESRQTITMQMEMEKKRQEKERETALADTQRAIVQSEQEVKIAIQNAESAKATAIGEAAVKITQTEAETTATKMTAEAEGEALRLKSTNESESIKLIADARASEISKIGGAEAAVIKLKTEAIGKDQYASIEVSKNLSTSNVKLVSDFQMGTTGTGSNNVADALLGVLAAGMSRANTVK